MTGDLNIIETVMLVAPDGRARLAVQDLNHQWVYSDWFESADAADAYLNDFVKKQKDKKITVVKEHPTKQ